jgi:zinc transporter ZupT
MIGRAAALPLSMETIFDQRVVVVALAALGTALATGLGALPLAVVREIPRRWLGLSNAVAGGLMLAASFSLVYEGIDVGAWRMLGGFVLGIALIALADRWTQRHADLSVADLSGADARKAIVILGVMTLHSFAEGIGVGVSFGGEGQLGLFISLAIAIHNVPEGLAIALVMIPRGTPVWKAAGWSVFSSLPQPLMAVPAFLFVEAFYPVLPVGLGLAAGAMVWMVFSELMPDALEDAPGNAVGVAVGGAMAAMLALSQLLPGH